MKRVGTADLKAHLSQHLHDVRGGETLIVLDRREPVARIVPYEDDEESLVITPAVGSLHDFLRENPAPAGATYIDVLEALREERGDRS